MFVSVRFHYVFIVIRCHQNSFSFWGLKTLTPSKPYDFMYTVCTMCTTLCYSSSAKEFDPRARMCFPPSFCLSQPALCRRSLAVCMYEICSWSCCFSSYKSLFLSIFSFYFPFFFIYYHSLSLMFHILFFFVHFVVYKCHEMFAPWIFSVRLIFSRLFPIIFYFIKIQHKKNEM